MANQHETASPLHEWRRANARAHTCKSRVSRTPIPDELDAYPVRIDGREVGLLRKFAGGSWSAVYTVDGANRRVADDMPQRSALHMLKVVVMEEDERRVVAELDVAVELARDLMPAGVLIRAGLREIRAGLLAGVMSPAVATMNAVHLLAHVTGVNASR